MNRYDFHSYVLKYRKLEREPEKVLKKFFFSFFIFDIYYGIFTIFDID